HALGSVELFLELYDGGELVFGEIPCQLEMSSCGVPRLISQRQTAAVGHQLERNEFARFRILGQQRLIVVEKLVVRRHTVRQGRQMSEVDDGARPPVDGYVGIFAVEPVDRMRVAPCRSPNDFDRETRCDALWRPRDGYANQAAFQQQRMRSFLSLRQMRAIRSVDRREKRVFPPCSVPNGAHRFGRQGHPVRRLMTRYAGAPVGAERREKGMAGRVQLAGIVDQAKAPFRVRRLANTG